MSSPSPHQSQPSNHSSPHGAHARHSSPHAIRRSIPHQKDRPGSADQRGRPLRTPFSIIAILSDRRGREIVDILGEHGNDLMAAALSLDQRGMTCRRVFDLLDDSELHSVAAMWLPVDVQIPPISREELISLLCDLAHD